MTFLNIQDERFVAADEAGAKPVAVANPIPDERSRPCHAVLDAPYQAPDGSKYRAGVWYFGVKPGKGDAPSMLTQHWVCSPLHIDAVTYDSAGNSFGRLLRFCNTLGAWRQWAMPMELLRGDGADMRGVLLSMGVQIDSSNTGRNALGSYLQNRVPARRMECVLQTGWAGADFKAFALPDAVIGPHAARVTFQSEIKGLDEYSLRGTLDGWQQGVAQAAVGNPLLMLALSVAFAGPLLALCGVESGGIHLIGDSSTGKTTALLAACSVWGGDGYRRSWRTTANGLEGAAAMFNDSLLALDEISECDPRAVGEVIYMLGNGRGKQRASRLGTARSVARWRSSVISTGERSIATTMTEGGHRVKAGQAVRVLDIPAQRAYGAWDTLHAHEGGPAFSDALKRTASRHYGHAGRAFLDKLTRDTSDMDKQLETIKGQLLEGVHSCDGQPARAAARLAVLGLAGELATQYGITGWAEGDATRAARVSFEAWLALRGDVSGNAEEDQIVQAMLGFIDRHGDSRFSDAHGPLDDKRLAMVRDRAGWWQSTTEGMEYLFTSEGMREALKGFDFHRAIKVLQATGLLAPPGKDGKAAGKKRIDKRSLRVYVIRPEKLSAS